MDVRVTAILKRILKVLVLSTFVQLGLVNGQEESPIILDGGLVGDSLVVLREDGTMTAWSMPDGEKNMELSNALGNQGFSAIASSDGWLWGANGKAILQWSFEDQHWTEVAPQFGEDLLALVALDGDLAQVYERVVVGTASGQRFEVPKLGGQLEIDYLRVLSLYPQGETLWIGTGQGEFGGHLIALNLRTGRWRISYDPYHYVTGITRASDTGVYVSWSASHFRLMDSVVRVHASSTNVTHQYEQSRGVYYQHVSFNPFDLKLYGVERNALVEVTSQGAVELADLGPLPVERERYAIGVGPAIVALVPVASDSMVILHKRAAPILFRNGHAQRLAW